MVAQEKAAVDSMGYCVSAMPHQPQGGVQNNDVKWRYRQFNNESAPAGSVSRG